MPWWAFALVSAFCWGLYGLLSERGLDRHSAYFILFLESMVILAALPFWAKSFKADFQQIWNGGTIHTVYVLGAAVAAGIASLFYLYAISSRNAAVASLIEVSYPLFIVAIAFFMFKQFDLNVYSAIGAILIFIGLIVLILGEQII